MQFTFLPRLLAAVVTLPISACSHSESAPAGRPIEIQFIPAGVVGSSLSVLGKSGKPVFQFKYVEIQESDPEAGLFSIPAKDDADALIFIDETGGPEIQHLGRDEVVRVRRSPQAFHRVKAKPRDPTTMTLGEAAVEFESEVGLPDRIKSAGKPGDILAEYEHSTGVVVRLPDGRRLESFETTTRTLFRSGRFRIRQTVSDYSYCLYIPPSMVPDQHVRLVFLHGDRRLEFTADVSKGDAKVELPK